MSSFADSTDVGSILTPPQQYDAQMTQQIDDIDGKLGIIDDVWQFFFGYSLLERIFTPLSGDWGELKSMAAGWENLGEAADGVGENLMGVANELGKTWQGKAYHAFESYIGKWESSLSNEAEMAHEMAAWVRDIADNTKAAFEMIIATLNLIIDIVLAAVKISTIPVYGQIKAIQKAKEAVTLAYKIFTTITALFSLVQSFIDYVTAFQQCLDEGDDNAPAPSGHVATPEAI